MKLWGGGQQLEWKDEDGTLLLSVTTPPFSIRFYIAATISLVSLALAVTGHNYLFFGFVFVSSLYGAIKSASVQVAELYVQESGLSSGDVSLKWTEISSLEYRSEEDGPNGLYAVTGTWSGSFLLKDVDREIADRMIDKIYRRFPLVTMANHPLFFILPEQEIITLGLSKKSDAE